MPLDTLHLNRITLDPSAQCRVEHPQVVIDAYAYALDSEGVVLPPVVVFHDGETYWLADGHLTYAAYLSLGKHTLPADVRPGGLRDAQLYAAGANAAHGLQRTYRDKRRAVEVLAQDREWGRWSDRKISRHVGGISHHTVANIRSELSGLPAQFGLPAQRTTEDNTSGDRPEVAAVQDRQEEAALIAEATAGLQARERLSGTREHQLGQALAYLSQVEGLLLGLKAGAWCQDALLAVRQAKIEVQELQDAA